MSEKKSELHQLALHASILYCTVKSWGGRIGSMHPLGITFGRALKARVQNLTRMQSTIAVKETH